MRARQAYARLVSPEHRFWLLAATYTVTLQGAVSGPIAARILGPTGRGQLAVVLTTAYVVTGLACLGFPAALTGRASRYSDEAIGAAVRPWLAASTSVSLLAVPAVCVAARAVGVPVLDVLPAALVAALLNGLTATSAGRLIAARDFRRLFLARLVGSLLVILGLGAAFIAGAGTGSVMSIYLLAGIAPAVVRPSKRSGVGDGEVDPESLRHILKEDVPRLTVASFLNLSNARLDQVVLPLVLANASLGLYAVAVNYGTLVAPLGVAIATASALRVARSEDDRQRPELLLPLVASACLLVVAPVTVPLLFGKDFAPAVGPAMILTVGGFLLTCIAILGARATALGHARDLIPGEVAALLTLPLTLPLGARFGASGAALAAVLAYLANLVALAIMLRRRHGASSLPGARASVSQEVPTS